MDTDAQSVLQEFANKILTKRKEVREQKLTEQFDRQYAHKKLEEGNEENEIVLSPRERNQNFYSTSSLTSLKGQDQVIEEVSEESSCFMGTVGKENIESFASQF